MNMVKPGIQTRRRKPKGNNGNGSGANPNSKSKHNKNGTSATSVKEPVPCASEPTIEYDLTTSRKHSSKYLFILIHSFLCFD